MQPMFAESVPHHRRSIARACALVVAGTLLAVVGHRLDARHPHRPHRATHTILRVGACGHTDYVFVVR